MNLRNVSRFVPALVIPALITAFFADNSRVAHAEANPAHANAAQQYGALPMSFIANAGQVDSAVRFQVRGSGGTLSFESDGVMLSLPSALTLNPSPKGRGTFRTAFPSPAGEGLGVRAIRLSFEGANPNAHIDGADQLPGIANFFIGSDSNQWHTNVSTYAGVVYHDLYPGVDLQYGGHTGLLKGTYTLAAGVDPSLIRWRYDGADNVRLDSSTGDLTIHAPDGVTLNEQAPIAWQTRGGGQQTPVAVGYMINSDRSVQFTVGAYTRALPVTVDPDLDYSTYLGGSDDDTGFGITRDESGNIYVTGFTSGNFPISTNAYQTTYNGGGWDVFVTKLNPTGSGLVYSTYLGGSGYDQGSGIAVDANGSVYLTGWTSGNFPVTTGAYQMTYGGGNIDAFISKLNPTGSGLVYSTYLGGSSADDVGYSIAVDGNGNAYITGYTDDIFFPVTAGAYQTVLAGGNFGGWDAFVSKLNLTGSALVYSTYLGGGETDYAYGIAVDGSGNAYIAGTTAGTSGNTDSFPTTPGAYQTTYGGSTDGFVSKLNSIGDALAYSTYLGGSGDDGGSSIVVDGSGNAYVAGYSFSTDFPTTSGAYQTTLGGPSGTADAFVTKLNALGDTLVYSTYLGGSSTEVGYAIAIDHSGNAYTTGYTFGANFPTTPNAYQATFGGGKWDVFVTKLNTTGSGLIYSTYLGGSGDDWGYGIAVDGSANVYVAGRSSSGFPTTSGAYQTAYGGGNTDAFVSKFSLPTLPIDTIGIYRINQATRTATFFLRLSNSTGNADITLSFGGVNAYPVVGDWAGAGFDTVGIFDQNNGQFSLRNSNTSGTPDEQFVLGNPNDMPLSGKWLANATHFGVGVFRPSNGLIYLKNNLVTGFADDAMVLGIPGDTGLAGDWNSDGQDSPGVYRSSNITFYLTDQVTNGPVTGNYQFQYGNPGDVPVIGDWIGQGHDGVGLFRQSNGFTYLRNALTTGYADNTFTYGIAGDVPVAGHWQLTYPPAPNPVNILVAPTAAPVPTYTAPDDSISD